MAPMEERPQTCQPASTASRISMWATARLSWKSPSTSTRSPGGESHSAATSSRLTGRRTSKSSSAARARSEIPRRLGPAKMTGLVCADIVTEPGADTRRSLLKVLGAGNDNADHLNVVRRGRVDNATDSPQAVPYNRFLKDRACGRQID